jgi:hypothetical protein
MTTTYARLRDHDQRNLNGLRSDDLLAGRQAVRAERDTHWAR